MDTRISTFLRTNDAPSDIVFREVKERLKGQSQELSEAEAAIERLNSELRDLKEKRATIQASIDQNNIIISPIRRVPPDVLCEIFHHCLPTHRNSIMNATEAPVILTRVCSGWRSIAFSFPRLWAQLHIPLILPFNEGADPSEKVVHDHALALRLQVVEQWLSRSGSCPLSLSISFPSSQISYLVGVNIHTALRVDPFIQKICDIIILFAPRWQVLELSVPLDIYYHLQNLVSPSKLCILRTLRLSIPNRGIRMPPTNPPLKFLDAPNLRKISLSAAQTIWSFNPATTLMNHWEGLTHLSILSSFPDIDVLPLLKRCHNLVECSLTVLSRRNSGRPQDEDVVISGTANLPNLKSLSLNDAGSPSVMSKTFKAIHAPSLAFIKYFPLPWRSAGQVFPPHVINPPPQTENLQPSPILSLLETSLPLRKLALDSYAMNSRDIVLSLQLVGSSLINLVLGRELPNHLASVASYYHQRQLHTDRYNNNAFNPDLLGVSPLSDEEPILVPNLEVLTLHQLSRYTDESLKQLVIGRIAAWKQGRVAALKLLEATFDRERRLDIVDAVMQTADNMGMDIKLDLKYVPSKPKHLRPLSASFGLTANDCSWISDTQEVW